jgi:hypothetical protein
MRAGIGNEPKKIVTFGAGDMYDNLSVLAEAPMIIMFHGCLADAVASRGV